MVSMKFVRRLTVAAAIAAALVPHAGAQSHHRHENTVNRQYRLARAIKDTYSHQWEVAGGLGGLRFEPGTYLRRDNQFDWATNGTYYFTPAYGIVADVRGHYGDVRVNNPTCSGISPDITCTPSLGRVRPLVTEYTFMGGPQWRFYRREKFAVSAHVLGGLSMGNFDGGTHGIPAPEVGIWPTSNVFAASAGVNLDYNFYPNFAFRVQPTYVYTHFGSANQNNKGINLELVYRFGRQK
jgi:hypothetical protein